MILKCCGEQLKLYMNSLSLLFEVSFVTYPITISDRSIQNEMESLESKSVISPKFWQREIRILKFKQIEI